jgi:uncharacterized protein YcgI (DUF1989 family)
MNDHIIVPARRGKALRLEAGRCIDVVNVHGQQVVDTWALNGSDADEELSMEHTRSCLDKLGPATGDSLYSNRRRPILTLEMDTSPGIHDTLLSACDEERYRLLGFQGRHGSCAENFNLALSELGIGPRRVPSPWNMFERVVIEADGRLRISPPQSRPGDFVRLRAVIDVIAIFSACPMDIVPTNGPDCTPRDIHLRLG